jgi:hypothetical protein
MNRTARFKKTDVTRALKGAAAAGAKVSRVEIGGDGQLVLVLDDPVRQEAPSTVSAYDAWRAKRDARTS